MTDSTIRRGRHDKDNPYFVGSRALAQNKDLSYGAAGLLFYLLSKPDDWQVKVSDLKRSNVGRDKVQGYINELVAAGYITPRTRIQNAKGHWSWTPYYVYEEPQPITEKPISVEPISETQEIKEHNKSIDSLSSSLSTEEQKRERQKTLSPAAPEDPPSPSVFKDEKPAAEDGAGQVEPVKFSDVWEAVSKAWQNTNGPYVGQLAKMLIGTHDKKAGQYYQWQINDPPMTPLEIAAFGVYIDRIGWDTMPQKPETIWAAVHEFRGSDQYESLMRFEKAYAELTARQAAAVEVEEEPEYITPEEHQQMLQSIKDLAERKSANGRKPRLPV